MDSKEHAVRTHQTGFSLVEILMVCAIASTFLMIAMAGFRGLIDTSRRDGAAGLIAGDVRMARASAIRTGWQYRIYGFKSSASDTHKNQYRLMGRRSSAVAWPDPTDQPMQSATQMLGPWVNIPKMYPGVRLSPNASASDFSVTFDSRGVRVAVDPSFDPLVINNLKGAAKSIKISAVGSVEIQ